VGGPQTVANGKLSKFVFEGAIRNFPSPAVDKDNVNYLAGVREIGAHSEFTDGRDMPRLLVRSVEFEGPFYESWPPASHKNIFVDFDHKSNQPAYARKILGNFATKAYRRPVTQAEENQLVSVYEKSCASGRSFQDSIKDALLVVLTSPQFLLITEKSQSPAPEPLDSYELSSKLSYFLWNSPPDTRMLQLAASGTIRSQLDAEVKRMIADPKFSLFTSEFASQWLSLDKFQVLEPDRKRYPKLTRDARAQLKQEPVEFVQYLIRNNLPVKNLVQSDFVMANETVASYYDLAEKPDTGFRFVPIVHHRPELGGVLTEAAIMAGLSDECTGAEGRYGRPDAEAEVGAASQSECMQAMPREDRPMGRGAGTVRCGRAVEDAADGREIDAAGQHGSERVERFEAVSGRGSHRSGGV
jgi:hypothetical protein